MDRATLERDLIGFVRAEFPGTDDIDRDTPLIASGIVDSIGLLRLVRIIEDRFKVNVEAGDLVLTNFGSVRAIIDFVIKNTEGRQ